MKRRFICMILAVVMGACLMSCESKKDIEGNEASNIEQSDESKTEDFSEKDEKTKKSSDSNKANDKSSSNNSADNKKKIYKEKLENIQAGLSDLDSYYAGNTVEMKHAASEEYKRWDDALNEIYAELKKDLSKDKMSVLEKEEANWIKEKENKAKAAAEEYKGGTAESLQYTASLAETTKSRCYELVEKYMK